MKFNPGSLDFNEIVRTPDGHHIGTVQCFPTQFALHGVEFQISNDTSGGRFKIISVSVFDMETGPAGHPGAATLVTESDGTRPLSFSKGQLVEVKIEYLVETVPLPAGTFSATLLIRGQRFGSTRKDSASIPLHASSLKRLLVVLDGRFTLKNGKPDGTHYASFGPGDPTTVDSPSADNYFGLSEVIRTLQALPLFRVVKAHRDLDPTDFTTLSAADQVLLRPDFEHFKFDEHDLSQFDQMWLFGVGGPSDTDPVSDAELIAIARFMNGGGGMFATGDHENLGQPLCSRVLRVRSMRKWFFPTVGPDGEPIAPPGGTASNAAQRMDTTQPGHRETRSSPDFAFSDQSDDIPQPITPTPAGLAHPLLKLSDGRILSVLPDHMHEGEVIDPSDPQFQFSATMTYNKGKAGEQTFVEYPRAHDGRQLSPQILATGTVLGGHTTRAFEQAHVGSPTPTQEPDRVFGVIGAYDGHQVGVGRVCVDSTWHHFFDINLIGDPVAKTADPGTVPPVEEDFIKNHGFKATADGRAHLADIEGYYRNIATWLARAGA
jgi:hypothetical protein